MTRTIEIQGADPEQLRQLRSSGVDHNGDPVEPFTDHEGGWPLRCCLTDSTPGDELAIVAWSPFPWRGPFAETGPIVIHAHPCRGVEVSDVPAQFLTRRQLVRPYARDRRIAYDRLLVVEPDGSLPTVLEDLLGDDDIDFVHVRNVLAGCFSFTAQRSGEGRQA
jgi:hypothetical protein